MRVVDCYITHSSFSNCLRWVRGCGALGLTVRSYKLPRHGECLVWLSSLYHSQKSSSGIGDISICIIQHATVSLHPYRCITQNSPFEASVISFLQDINETCRFSLPWNKQQAGLPLVDQQPQRQGQGIGASRLTQGQFPQLLLELRHQVCWENVLILKALFKVTSCECRWVL